MPTRRILLAAPALFATPAFAQDAWPTRPIRMVLPYAAGGPTDIIARLVAERLSTRLPQRVVVENRTGAAGSIGASFVAKSPPDGYTILFTNIGHAVLRAVVPTLDFDPERDLTAITIVAESPMVLLVPPNAPWRSVGDLAVAARSQPGRLTYGTAGGGGALQLVALRFLRAAALEMTEVPYRGSAPAALDLAAGTLDMLYDAGATGFPLAQGRRARALAVSGPQRSPVMPDVPTIAEAGFPEATFMVWQAILAPAATPPAIVARLQQETAAVLAEPAVRARLAELGAERVIGNPPAEAQRFVQEEAARWATILREAGLRPN
ncbi:Bug family tripartite tricarboxylate transporter substrate binding protein [Falsiroseomonas sp. HW251]|uniref:Bug family tripartite tricarboxylate transporter substrate binding protein n=1 Tax=Falsiroseomonas sp. HW251 TaxID=3390998 RepID=UPI003D319297